MKKKIIKALCLGGLVPPMLVIRHEILDLGLGDGKQGIPLMSSTTLIQIVLFIRASASTLWNSGTQDITIPVPALLLRPELVWARINRS